MLKNLISTLGNVSSDIQLDRRELLAAAGIALAGCKKEQEPKPAQKKEPVKGPIVTELEFDLEQIANTHTYHTGGAMGAYGDKVHIFGGTLSEVFADKAKTSVNIHEVLDPRNPTKWEKLKQRMPKPRYAMAATVYDNRILVVGGCGPEGEYNNTVFTFDPCNGWQTLDTRFPTGLRYGSAVVSRGDAYVAGGWTGKTQKDSVHNPFIYKLTKSGDWKDVARILHPNRVGKVAAVGEKIILLGQSWGGRKDIPEPLQIYDTQTGEWEINRMPGWLYCDHVFAHNHHLLVLGSMELQIRGKKQYVHDGLFEYSPHQDRWSYLKSFDVRELSKADVWGNSGNQIFAAGCRLYHEREGLAYKGTIDNMQRQQIS